MTNFEDEYLNEVRSITTGPIQVVADDAIYIQRLRKRFPFSSRLEWEKGTVVARLSAPPARRRYGQGGDSPFKLADYEPIMQEFLRQLAQAQRIPKDQTITILGDNISFAILTQWHVVEQDCVLLFAHPQHMYIFPENVSWCLIHTFEDDVLFLKASE